MKIKTYLERHFDLWYRSVRRAKRKLTDRRSDQAISYLVYR